jgi:thiol-disulfide isomerase/thioredoxin
MVSLQDKYYGLSILSWLIILILIVLFYFTLSSNESSNESTNSASNSASNSAPNSAPKNMKENFGENNKIKVYNFNTSWCGYSVRFQPEWDAFEKEVKAKNNLSNVEAHDIKCDDPRFEQMCKNYEVPGFPTIIIQKGNDKKVYKGPRNAQSIIETVEKMS